MLCLPLNLRWKFSVMCASIKHFDLKISRKGKSFFQRWVFFQRSNSQNLHNIWASSWTKMAVETEGESQACKHQQTWIVRPFYWISSTHYQYVEQCLWFNPGKRARANKKKWLLCFWFWRKKGCGSSNKHSVWICLLGSDVIQWQFNWILLL